MAAAEPTVVTLREKISFVLQVVVAIPGIVIPCVLRRLRQPSDYSLAQDLLLSAVRKLGRIPLSIRRLSSKRDYLSAVRSSSRFSNADPTLGEAVSGPDFQGYWVCRGSIRDMARAPSQSKLTILWIHGGGYINGKALAKLTFLLRIAELLEEQNITVNIFALEYSLTPEAQFPTQINEATAAYKYLIDETGIDPTTIMIFGESAGGHLALSLVHNVHRQRLPKPGKLGLLYPWVNLDNSGSSFITNKHKDCLSKVDMDRWVDWLLGGDGRLKFADFVNFASSPPRNGLRWSEVLPPTWVIIGGNDVLLSDACKFVDEARKDGAIVDLSIEAGRPHGWLGYLDSLAEKEYLGLSPSQDATSVLVSGEMIGKVVIDHYHGVYSSHKSR